MADVSARIERERDFFDHVVPTIDEAINEFRHGPDPNTRRMLDVARPGAGRRILDFACGAGVTTAWLAERGAEVVGVDLSSASIHVARELMDRLGLSARFEVANVESDTLPEREFDAIVGRYALHHLDLDVVAKPLAQYLVGDGVAAFVETMAMNPLLNIARDHLVGRFGIPRFGTLDEHPLSHHDIERLRQAFGHARLETAEYRFISMLDRQVLQGRYPAATSALRRVDDWLAKRRAVAHWGFHQIVILSNTTAGLASV